MADVGPVSERAVEFKVFRWQDADARVSVSDESPDPLERHCRGWGNGKYGVDSCVTK